MLGMERETQEDGDSQGLGLKQQHGFNEWKYKHQRRNGLEDCICL